MLNEVNKTKHGHYQFL